jgi:regulator of cell morphogenesis and NO signaling
MTTHEANASGVPMSATVGELVARHPARAELFERLRFDFCCGGAKTLAEACDERGLDHDTIRQLIAATDAVADPLVGVESRDWWQASLSELCDHIVEVHHDALRRNLPQIQELLDSVMRVHGSVHLELRELPAAFAGLRSELEPHIELEERTLFPACRALEESDHSASIDKTAADAFEDDHREVGRKLARLRELTGEYDTTAGALCRTHRRLIEALRSLELDVHQHVHEENNIMSPRVRSLLRTRQEHIPLGALQPHDGRANRPERSREQLPLCCRGWLAEQTHRAASPRAH